MHYLRQEKDYSFRLPMSTAAGPRFLNCYPRCPLKPLNKNIFEGHRGKQNSSAVSSKQGKLARIFALAAACLAVKADDVLILPVREPQNVDVALVR